MDSIDKFYFISKLTNDNIEVVASLIELMQKPKQLTIKQLEDHKLTKLDDTLEKIMDLKVSTIKDISKCLSVGA